jgi:predicted nucleic acid-binding protein
MIAMTARILLDTNVLVYVYDTSAPRKRSVARSTLSVLAEAGAGAVSTQVLSEFFSVTTKFLLKHQEALDELQHQVHVWTVLPVTTEVILTAARAVRDHRLNFWDAQLWAAAKIHGIDTIFSEDFNSGSVLGGVRFVNLFEPGFHLPKFVG